LSIIKCGFPGSNRPRGLARPYTETIILKSLSSRAVKRRFTGLEAYGLSDST
jgi:hypothetical protein